MNSSNKKVCYEYFIGAYLLNKPVSSLWDMNKKVIIEYAKELNSKQPVLNETFCSKDKEIIDLSEVLDKEEILLCRSFELLNSLEKEILVESQKINIKGDSIDNIEIGLLFSPQWKNLFSDKLQILIETLKIENSIIYKCKLTQ